MNKQKALILVSAVLLFVLAGCSAGAAAPTATPTPTSPPPPTEAPPVATAEPEAEAETADPTAIPEESEDSVRTFIIVPDSSKALYRVEEEFLQGAVDRLGKELGFNTAVGFTRTIEGSIEMSPDDLPEVLGGTILVDIRSLVSDDNKRDERIQEQHLESNRFPTAEFVITGVDEYPTAYTEGEEVTFKLIGDLTIREITNEVVWEVTAVLEGDTLIGTATTSIMMVDYGFDPPTILGFIEALDPAVLEMEITAVEGEAAAAE